MMLLPCILRVFVADEGEDGLKDFGFSKDQKFGEVQVVFGLLVNSDGRPIGFEVFRGNTFEGHTLEKSLEKLKKDFEVSRIIVVGDRGKAFGGKFGDSGRSGL